MSGFGRHTSRAPRAAPFAEAAINLPHAGLSLTLGLAARLAFVHIDGDLYQSVLDALEKVWDLVVPGGIVVIDDFFHKVQGPARARLLIELNWQRGAVRDFFRSRDLNPTLHVAPAYAVLVTKGSANCVGPRAMDGNFYSFELLRSHKPFVTSFKM